MPKMLVTGFVFDVMKAEDGTLVPWANGHGLREPKPARAGDTALRVGLDAKHFKIDPALKSEFQNGGTGLYQLDLDVKAGFGGKKDEIIVIDAECLKSMSIEQVFKEASKKP